MKIEDSKKLTANEVYLNECMSILYTKIRALGFDGFEKKGNVIPNNVISIENYEHGTITCECNPKGFSVNLDGTNFSALFLSDEKGGFSYKVKPIGLEYTCYDRKLDDTIHEKKLIRAVGSSADYCKYLSCGTFFILLEHYIKDENGITIVKNTNAQNYTEQQLIDYIQEQMQITKELELYDDDEQMEEDIDEDSEIWDKPQEECDGILVEQKDSEEIEVYSSDDDYADICQIDYVSSNKIEDEQDNIRYKSNYPDRIEDFDYQTYIAEAKGKSGADSKQEESAEDNQYEQDEVVVDEDDFNNSNYDEDIEENSSGDLYSWTDTEINSEGFIDDSVFKVIQNGVLIESNKKPDIVDKAVIDIMDADQELMTLKDYYEDIHSEIEKIKTIIQKRKERIKQKKLDQSNLNVRDTGRKEDKDIL